MSDDKKPADVPAAEPPADTLTISGVTLEVGTDGWRGELTFSVTCAGLKHGPYVFAPDEIGALAAWLAEHAEAGGQ